ncbi:MAG TPA: 1-deoxy-D-xylulose-5-phosphate synthase N-terminal domain-containing protein [Gemmatimonadales bacterium]|nr:1-deoxy-D-xylulose-5-phosphate synthase N-terminal domain-containing protein [Gemmatimonadales bacterium]
MTLLSTIKGPADLKRLAPDQLPQLAEEVRARLIEGCSLTGGHIGASLGVVELAIALLYEFDSPRDKILWDVGHQAYAWKLLTGRNDGFETLRQVGGISGFLKRSESEHDHFGAGHAATAMSAALGMATARDLHGDDYKVVAIVGDGAMTCGLSYEGMNNAGTPIATSSSSSTTTACPSRPTWARSARPSAPSSPTRAPTSCARP